MTTYISLTCTNCGKEFKKSKPEYQRRLAKLPGNTNFFCNRNCTASFRNNKRVKDGTFHYPQQPQYGNTYRQKYDPHYTWYIHRITTDRRAHIKAILTESERQEFVIVLDDIWDNQEGKCAFTGLELERRVGQFGKTETNNPFLIASLDRIDNAKPYSADNIHWVSVGMNLARNKLSVKDFKDSLSVLI